MSLVVGASRAGDFRIARALVAKLATASGRDVAEVRSAVALSEDQVSRAASLKQATGKDVDVRVTVDPSVLGGIVTTIGDTVIDGSVRPPRPGQEPYRLTCHSNDSPPHQNFTPER